MTVATSQMETISSYVYPFLFATDDVRGADYAQSILVVESIVARIDQELRVVVIGDQIFPRTREWIARQLIARYDWPSQMAYNTAMDAVIEADALYVERKQIGEIPFHLYYRRRIIRGVTYCYESGTTGQIPESIATAIPTLAELISLNGKSDPDSIDQAIACNIEQRAAVKRDYANQMIFLTKKLHGIK